MSPNNCLIYGLVDPRTDAVRYIGQSCVGMMRPERHRYGYLSGRLVRDWVAEMGAVGTEYVIRVLEELPDAAVLDDAECFWIAQGRGLGWDLVNRTKGARCRKRPAQDGGKNGQ